MAAKHLKQSLGLIALSAALALVGCGGDGGEEKPPKRDGGGLLEPEEDAGDEPDAEETDGGVEDDAGEGTLQASAAEAKKNGWQEGCYKKPTKNEEFLNSCASGFRAFDKTLYPASWKEGEALPALP
jgi:hypothetical protein